MTAEDSKPSFEPAKRRYLQRQNDIKGGDFLALVGVLIVAVCAYLNFVFAYELVKELSQKSVPLQATIILGALFVISGLVGVCGVVLRIRAVSRIFRNLYRANLQVSLQVEGKYADKHRIYQIAADKMEEIACDAYWRLRLLRWPSFGIPMTTGATYLISGVVEKIVI